MGNILSSLSKTIHASLALAIIVFLGLFYQNDGFSFDRSFWSWITRFAHVVVAIMWIGLLWYFNFVQIPNMAKIPDEQKPAIGKVIAPAALFYFRWAAALTILSGFILAWLNGYLHDAMTLSVGSGVPRIIVTVKHINFRFTQTHSLQPGNSPHPMVARALRNSYVRTPSVYILRLYYSRLYYLFIYY